MNIGRFPAPLSPNVHSAAVISYSSHGDCFINVTARRTLGRAVHPGIPHCEAAGGEKALIREPTVREVLAALGDPRARAEHVFGGVGEPTLRLYEVLDIAAELRRRGAARIRLDTDGLASLVYGRDVTPDLEGPIDALSILLVAQNEEVYNRYCRPALPGSYRAMRDFADRARDYVPEITLIAIEGLAGVDIAACARIARDLGVRLRVCPRHVGD